ncbi:MAG: sugar transferase [Coriobacteriia bacterium]|nr:sugar transferase [Coriobacteriia bacterium]
MTLLRAPEFPSRLSRKRRVVTVLLVTDTLALLAATLLAAYVRFDTPYATAGFENIHANVNYYEISIVVTMLWLIALATDGMYDLERLSWGAGEFSRVLRAMGMGVVALILATYALKTPGLSRSWTLVAFALAVVFVTGGRLLIRAWLHWRRMHGHMHRRTHVVGNNAEALSIVRTLLKNPGQGLTPVGCLASSKSDELELDYCEGLVEGLGHAREIKKVVLDHDIDTVMIAGSAFDHEVISRIIAELRGLDVSIHVSSGLFDILTSRVLVRDIAGVPLITVKSISLSAGNLRTKRVFDVLVASAIVLVGLPIWLALALAIIIDSRGPVFYKQARVGRHGTAFGMYKFRSMVSDADARLAQLLEDNEATGPLFKMKDDPRVTRVGKWMRKFSVDEFPQLLNVLRGEMSLVGPRPPLIHETVQYTEQHWRRMEVPPGMTGLWQVSGRSSLTFEEMIRLDLYYIENWSVGFDLALMVRTIPAVLFARGAY